MLATKNLSKDEHFLITYASKILVKTKVKGGPFSNKNQH